MVGHLLGLTVLSLFTCISCQNFGYNNSYTCHCGTGSTCDTTSGICSSGSCQAGWYGPSCQKQNVALGKSTNQSFGSASLPSRRAVDGSTTVCADSGYNANPTWLVNLQQTYPIRDVRIYYKADRLQYFKGFSMYVINKDEIETLCYKHEQPTNPSPITDVRCNINGQYIKFINPRNDNYHFMSLCEVLVFVCSVGTYGSDCSMLCYCANFARCSQDNGVCPNNKCQTGWMGNSCNKECTEGTFGVDCNEMCHCYNNAVCHHVTGQCPGRFCAPGWLGDNCQQECIDSYGVNCSSQCGSRHCAGRPECNHINGSCVDGCKPGYQTEDCTQKCSKGWYGEGCSMNCSSRHCGNPIFACDHVTGSCGVSGCSAGYSGSDCQQECANGLYGINCTAKCSDRFCEMSSPCHHVTGNCEGKCKENYNGTDCTQKLISIDDGGGSGGDPNITLIIAVSVSVAVIVVAGIAFVIWRRRRSPKYKEDEEDKEMTMVMNRNANLKMAVVKPQRHSAEDAAPIYENREFIQSSLEASNRELTEESGESDNEDIDLKVNQQSVYYNLPTTQSEFNYSELKDFIAKTKAENGFDSLFESLPTEFTSPYDASQLSENKTKNRFKGYYPYDNTRVKLSIQDGNPHTDFINANYLNGWNQPKAYIAAQGATDITTNDFIRMIWEQNCDKVVMVTREYEIAKIKCKRYWPENGTETFGDFKLTLIQEKTRADFTVRVVSIQKDNIKRQFHHFNYTSWPDHGVPDIHDLLDFLFTVNKVNPKSTKPQLVHCSAGVGRTGTYIAIDICLKQWKATGQVGVIPCIKKMRDNRKGMIQTDSQLKFVFEALLEGLTRGDTSLNKDVFEAGYEGHGYNLKMGRMSSPEHFQFLKSIQNDTANINKVYSEDKPLFSFSSYTNSKGYFFESLIGLDVDTMWTMIHDRKSSIAVFIRDNMNQTGLYPGSGCKEVYNGITVENISQENLSDKITRMSVSVTKKGLQTDLVVFMLNIKKSQVKNFRYLTQNILELLQHITVDQRIDDSITIFTSNLQYVRVFCILRNILQRILLDNEVEIVQNVRKMHQRIEKTIFTEEEFMVLYKVISEYIKSSGMYANL